MTTESRSACLDRLSPMKGNIPCASLRALYRDFERLSPATHAELSAVGFALPLEIAAVAPEPSVISLLADPRNLAAVLAGLRLLEQYASGLEVRTEDTAEILTSEGKFEGLNEHEIDALAQDLNCSDDDGDDIPAIDWQPHIDAFKPVAVSGGTHTVEWDYIGEGYSGDFIQSDKDDAPLLRFSVYLGTGEDREEVDCGSFCTQITIDKPSHELVKLAERILAECPK
jgi:hypothetical protein